MWTRILERAASVEALLALMCWGSTPACSPGAPETVSQTDARVPEFGSGLPAGGFGAANSRSDSPAEGPAPTDDVAPDAPVSGDAIGAAPGSAVAATDTATDGASVDGLDPGSVADSSSGGNAGSGNDPVSGSDAVSGANPSGSTDPSNDGATSASCSLKVRVTTSATTGRYSPRNVGAIWIADSSGRFIKSLEVWGDRRLEHVTAWNTATESAGAAANKVDAITSATSTAHRTHDVSWNCRDFADQPVSDGGYRVYFEVTEANGSGPTHFESFDKGPSPATREATATNFNGIVLTFTP